MIDGLREKKVSRRAFLKTIARAAIAACVSGASLILIHKKQIAYRDEDACGIRELCGGCARLEDCVLPQALLTRLTSARFSEDAAGYIRAPTDPGKNGTENE